MKKAIVILIFGTMFFGACSAQNVSAQTTNDAQRIIGTWKHNEIVSYNIGEHTATRTYTFNSNGTYEYSFVSTHPQVIDTRNSGNYFINGSKLIITSNSFSARLNDFYLSSNGRILFIGNINNENGSWYEKQ